MNKIKMVDSPENILEKYFGFTDEAPCGNCDNCSRELGIQKNGAVDGTRTRDFLDHNQTL